MFERHLKSVLNVPNGLTEKQSIWHMREELGSNSGWRTHFLT